MSLPLLPYYAIAFADFRCPTDITLLIAAAFDATPCFRADMLPCCARAPARYAAPHAVCHAAAALRH